MNSASNPAKPDSQANPANKVRFALLGCGTVGTALLEQLASQRGRIASQWGADLELAAVVVEDSTKQRAAVVPQELLSTDAAEVVARDDIDIIVEVMGGTNPTLELVQTALRSGKPLVTANKELLARCGAEVLTAAGEGGVRLYFEAAVAGGIPLIRPLQVLSAAEQAHTIMGIVNGTTNYILTQMAEHGATYEEALSQAQSLGYAERDPTADVEGHDAAAKAAILASIAAGTVVHMEDVYCEGITKLNVSDFEAAERLGYVVKLLAIVELNGGASADSNTQLMLRVHPALVPKSHPLAQVRDAFNAVFVEGNSVGELMFYGPGAGGKPTAVSVLSDLIEAASHLLEARNSAVARPGAEPAAMPETEPAGETTEPASPQPPEILEISALRSCYYFCVEVLDRPGVLSEVSGIFGQHNVSIKLMEQDEEVIEAGDARLVFLTHLASEKDMQAAVSELHSLDVVRQVNTLIRVIGHDD